MRRLAPRKSTPGRLRSSRLRITRARLSSSDSPAPSAIWSRRRASQPERGARGGEAAGDGGAVDAELDRQRVQREPVGEVAPEDAPLLTVERGDRAADRLVERLAITLLLVVHLGVVRGRAVQLAVVVGGGPGLPAQVHGDAERDHAHPARERALAVVLRDPRRRAVAAHEELVAHLLPDLVDEGRRGPEPRQVGAHLGEVRPVEGLDRAADARRAGAREVEVRPSGLGRQGAARPLGEVRDERLDPQLHARPGPPPLVEGPAQRGAEVGVRGRLRVTLRAMPPIPPVLGSPSSLRRSLAPTVEPSQVEVADRASGVIGSPTESTPTTGDLEAGAVPCLARFPACCLTIVAGRLGQPDEGALQRAEPPGPGGAGAQAALGVEEEVRRPDAPGVEAVPDEVIVARRSACSSPGSRAASATAATSMSDSWRGTWTDDEGHPPRAEALLPGAAGPACSPCTGSRTPPRRGRAPGGRESSSGAGARLIDVVTPPKEGSGDPLRSTPALLGAGQGLRRRLPVGGAEAAGLQRGEHPLGLLGRPADVERVDHGVLEQARGIDDEEAAERDVLLLEEDAVAPATAPAWSAASG